MNDTSLPYDGQRLSALAQLLISNIAELARAGWTPATSSNFSHRLDQRHAAITVSGRLCRISVHRSRSTPYRALPR